MLVTSRIAAMLFCSLLSVGSHGPDTEQTGNMQGGNPVPIYLHKAKLHPQAASVVTLHCIYRTTQYKNLPSQSIGGGRSFKLAG